MGTTTPDQSKVQAFKAQKVIRVRGAEGYAAPLSSQRAAAAVLTAKYRR